MPRRAKLPIVKVGRATLRALKGPDESDRFRWRLEWYPDGAKGKMRTRALGWGMQDRAETEAARIVADGLPREAAAAASVGLVDTVEDLMSFWVARQEDRADLAEATKRMSKQAGVHITRTIGHVRLDRLGQRELEHHRDARMREHVIDKWKRDRGPAAPETVSHELRLLRSAWKWGRSIGLSPEKDLPSIRIVPARKTKRTPTPAEVAATMTEMRPRYRLVVTLLWCTGARISEILGLQWKDVDIDSGVLRVDGKTGPRTVPLTVPALRMLKGVPEAERTGRLLEVARASVTCAIDDACEKAGVEHWSPHGLRRLAVDEMARARVDIGTAAAITGHTPVTMLRFYRQSTAADMAMAVQLAKLGYAPEGKVIPMKKGKE